MDNWAAAEILLTAAVLALAWPREDGFVIPERRKPLAWLRSMLPRARRQREEDAGNEADAYVTDLRADREQPLMTIRADQLPSVTRTWRSPVPPPQSACQPPWKPAENPEWTIPLPDEEPQEKPVRRAPRDVPTIVFEVMRPAVEGDLGVYLAELPSYYPDLGDSEAAYFVPPSSLALGAPDHQGAPQHVDDHGAEEEDLDPPQGGGPDVEGEEEEGRAESPGD